MYGRVVCADTDAGVPGPVAEELDDRTRQHYLAILQYFQSHNLMESMLAFEREIGLQYADGRLPVASVLESSLDMFARYTIEKDVLQTSSECLIGEQETGICCTNQYGHIWKAPSNITAVAWAALRHDDFTTIVACADRSVRVLNNQVEVMTELVGLASPVLSLAVAPLPICDKTEHTDQDVLATCMGGETLLLQLKRPCHGCAPSAAAPEWKLVEVERIHDHTKHVTTGKFAPLDGHGNCTQTFVTVSRDRHVRLYSRSCSSERFVAKGCLGFPAEATCCCWLGPKSLVVAVREDNYLHYYTTEGEFKEQSKMNMNALGDDVASFTILSLAVSSDYQLLAACTDKSRVIVFQSYTENQLRNLYGAVVDEYDIPSVLFSLDQRFVYTTSSLPAKQDIDMKGEVVVFGLKRGESVLHLPCHDKPVRCMDRHPLTEALVTGSFDKKLKYWM